MSGVTSLTPSVVVAAPGAQFTLALGLSNPDRVSTFTAVDEAGVSVSGTVTIHRNLALSTNPADLLPAGNSLPLRAKPGKIVITSSDPADVLTPDATNLSAVDVTAGLT